MSCAPTFSASGAAASKLSAITIFKRFIICGLVRTIDSHENVTQDNPLTGAVLSVFLQQLRFGLFSIVAQLLKNVGLSILLRVFWAWMSKRFRLLIRHLPWELTTTCIRKHSLPTRPVATKYEHKGSFFGRSVVKFIFFHLNFLRRSSFLGKPNSLKCQPLIK